MSCLLNNKFLQFYLILLFSLLGVLIQAQPDYKFKHLTKKDGLPNTYIQCIHQDRYGYMWFGSEDGLIRYNGFSYELYTYDEKDSNSISGSYVRAIVEDKKGNIWVGTTEGLNYFDRQKKTFKAFLKDKNIAESIQSNNIYSLAIDEQDNLWIGTNGAGVSFLNTSSHKFTNFEYNKESINGVSSNRIYSIFLDRDNRLWVGSQSGNIDLLLPESNEFIHIHIKDKITNEELGSQIRDFVQDEEGNIWIATSGSGIFKLKYVNEKEYNYTQYINESFNPNSLSKNFISSIAIDPYGNLIAGTENGGINYFDLSEGKIYHYYSEPLNNASISYNSIWCIYFDRSDVLWLSSITKGIDYHINPPTNFKHFYNDPFNPNSLSFNTVSCFFEDSQGNMWVGTDGGGLNLFNKENNTFKHYTTDNSNIGSNAILSIYEDSYENLWVGTWEGGLNLFDRKNMSFKQYNSQNSQLSCNNVISIYEDKDSVLWVGTFWCDGGVNKFDRETGTFTAYTNQNGNLCNNIVFSLLEDSRDRFWVGTIHGLSYLDKGEDKFKCFDNIRSDSTSLSHTTVFNVLESSDSIIWIGTGKGLNKFNYQDGTFTKYFVEDGLPHDHITGIEEDSQGNLWISTLDGLCCFNPLKKSFTNYKIIHGIQGGQFYRCSHYKAPDGTMYFGGVNGFNMFNPKDIKDIDVFLPMYFTSFKIFNKNVAVGENSALKKDISFVDTLVLKYNQNSFTFEFSAINYRAPEETNYEYVLEGFDKEWISAGKIGAASYTNINPGEYLFKAKIPYSSGFINNEGISVLLIITPPYWKTWWFRILVAFIVLSLLVALYSYRIRAVKKLNKHLEDLVNERTHELKEKNDLLREQTEIVNETNTLLEERQQQIEEQTEELMTQRDELERNNVTLEEYNATKDKFFSIIAHDIKNPLNTLLGYIELLKVRYDSWNDNKRKDKIEVLYSTSQHTYKLLENLLDWSRSQQGIIEFEPKLIDIQLLLNRTIDLFHENADQKNVSLHFNVDTEIEKIFADEQMLQTIMRNLISNAIKFSESGGAVELSVKKDNSNILIHVHDNGVGMTSDAINKLFRTSSNRSTRGTNDEGGTGLGLILVKEFVERHNGSILVKSTPGKGSTFSVSIPQEL